MKILLIDNLYDFNPLYKYTFSTGLLSIASILHGKDYPVEIINFHYLFSDKILDYNSDSLKNFETMVSHIVDKSPDIIGFTTMCNSFHNSLILSRLVKERRSNVKIIFGGPHASLLPEKILKNYEWIDLVCIGEGEANILDIIKGLEENDCSHIPGIARRDGNNIIKNPDMALMKNLDELPELNYSLIPYFDKCEYIPIEIGRGCPYNCIYCSTSRYWKRKFRIKSIERIAGEISSIKNTIDCKKVVFTFIHDTFTTNYNFTMNLCDHLKDIIWHCSARADSLDEKLIEKMSLSGCRQLYMGIETGSPDMQKSIKKHLDLSKVNEIISLLLKYNIPPVASFMYGFPEEREEELNLTLNMIHSLLKKGVTCQFHSLCVLAGTELYEEYNAKLILKDYFSDFSESSNLELSREFIEHDRELFAQFYTLEGTLSEEYILLEKFMYYIVILLYNYFPRTFDLIIKVFKNNMLCFYNDFLSNCHENFIRFFEYRLYMKDFVNYSQLISCMSEFFADYLKRKSSSLEFKIILNTFSMEYLKAGMNI